MLCLRQKAGCSAVLLLSQTKTPAYPRSVHVSSEPGERAHVLLSCCEPIEYAEPSGG